MDTPLRLLCEALKKVLAQFKTPSAPISFVLMTGKNNQGKTTLLRQSQFTHYPADLDHNANLFYSDHGVILELGEAWLTKSDDLLANTLKQLNRCHHSIRISGIILCIDSSDLLVLEPVQLIDQCKSHTHMLHRFGQALNYCIDVSIILTKLDALAGFCEFFQSEHANDLHKPLGFSLEDNLQRKKFIDQYKLKFDQMIEMLGQQIINKLHPARSSIKRTLIREFPLQIASLRVPLQALIQQISPHFFRVQTIYFTSAEQGGLSVDRLNKKIQHEYALTVQDKFPQSHNYRAYFIDGALTAFQQQTQRHAVTMNNKQKWVIGLSTSFAGIFLTYLGYHHFETSHLLDETSKELLSYETIINQTNDKTSALYHLSLAETQLNLIPNNLFSVPYIQTIKSQLHTNAKNTIHNSFIPDLTTTLEQAISNSSATPLDRYQALKIYLMLAEPSYFSEAEVLTWFNHYWKNANPNTLNDKATLVLKNALKLPLQPIAINQQLVRDTRNYLNALPLTYLYYSLAKQHFPQKTLLVNIEGFDVSNKELPSYFTKAGFKETIASLSSISSKLQLENWVLARNDLEQLPQQLEQAYCFEYVTWWQNFIHRTRPQHYQGYQQAYQLTSHLHKSNAIARLINFIQQQTSPELAEKTALFNQKIATQFTSLNLMSESASQELTQNINELEKFLTTLSVVNDDGQTVFNLTKNRFLGDTQSDPLSSLYNKARQLPEPISSWAKQIADDTWFIFINESKTYLNKKWQQNVIKNYQNTIANRYPFDSLQKEEVSLADFDHFFSPNGTLNEFVANYLKPFLDTSHPQWQPKELNGYVLPISADLINELIRANVISNMFFPDNSSNSKIDFSLQKINLDPVVANFQLAIGKTLLTDNQNSDSFTFFTWPQNDAKLNLNAIDGSHFELAETGSWAFFKMLQKVNVLVDSNDSASLQILFEVNGNSGRYLLKTQNQINPFSPGILTGFNLNSAIT